MSTSTDILAAIHFASGKHRTGRRKNKAKTPYINHPIAVAHHLATVAGVSDSATLIAAVLHDTIEDTETTREELDATFGVEIRQLVEEVTDDKTLEPPVRKQRQVEHASKLSDRAKLIKLADLTCNLKDVLDDPPASWSNERRMKYLEWTDQVVAACRSSNKKMEQNYYGLLEQNYYGLVLRGTEMLEEPETMEVCFPKDFPKEHQQKMSTVQTHAEFDYRKATKEVPQSWSNHACNYVETVVLAFAELYPVLPEIQKFMTRFSGLVFEEQYPTETPWDSELYRRFNFVELAGEQVRNTEVWMKHCHLALLAEWMDDVERRTGHRPDETELYTQAKVAKSSFTRWKKGKAGVKVSIPIMKTMANTWNWKKWLLSSVLGRYDPAERSINRLLDQQWRNI